MPTSNQAPFLAGVIEGFYGPPWMALERSQLIDWMATWGLNTYLYAPKDDLKHRAIWRQLYSPDEARELGSLIEGCQRRNLHFVYALSPGLDIHYCNGSELELLKKRFEQMLGLGCHHFCLLFDDIPDRMEPGDLERFGSLASAQAAVSNQIFQWVRSRQAEARFLFCPTPYCGRMRERNHGGEGYLPTLGRELLPEIDVLWTGPEIISREISLEHVGELRSVLKRKPMIWDNLHANDYDGRRFFCGPYAGRTRELREAVSGLLSNPNCEFPLNYIPIRTLAEFVQGEGPWDARASYLRALEAWKPQFATVGDELDSQDLNLFADCYYLPHEQGELAEELFQQLKELLALPPAQWGHRAPEIRRRTARLRDFCSRLTELRHRPLFHALSRRAWELREEMDLLDRYIGFKSAEGKQAAGFQSDFHLPETYRGGMVARLQRLLVQHPDATFTGKGEVEGEPIVGAQQQPFFSNL